MCGTSKVLSLYQQVSPIFTWVTKMSRVTFSMKSPLSLRWWRLCDDNGSGNVSICHSVWNVMEKLGVETNVVKFIWAELRVPTSSPSRSARLMLLTRTSLWTCNEERLVKHYYPYIALITFSPSWKDVTVAQNVKCLFKQYPWWLRHRLCMTNNDVGNAFFGYVTWSFMLLLGPRFASLDVYQMNPL